MSDTESHGARGWGPFTSRQLTTIVCVAILAVASIPSVALAASGAFTSNTASPAVTGTNSSRAVGAKGVYGNANATGNTPRSGVYGLGSGSQGVGVQGKGYLYGVYSDGPLGIRPSAKLQCKGCVTFGDLAESAKTYCSGYPHEGVNWHIPNSRPGRGCDFSGANLQSANLRFSLTSEANFSRANLSEANVSNAYAISTNFSEANLTSTDFTWTVMSLANFTGANLTDANFTHAGVNGANFTGADVTGVIWSDTRCPDETNSDDNGGTCVGHLVPL